VPLRTIDWQNRSHFFAVAAQQLRRVLVDYAARAERKTRRRPDQALPGRRGRPVVDRDERPVAMMKPGAAGGIGQRAAKVIELRYFGGLSEKEAAERWESLWPAQARLGFARTCLPPVDLIEPAARYNKTETGDFVFLRTYFKLFTTHF